MYISVDYSRGGFWEIVPLGGKKVASFSSKKHKMLPSKQIGFRKFHVNGSISPKRKRINLSESRVGCAFCKDSEMARLENGVLTQHKGSVHGSEIAIF